MTRTLVPLCDGGAVVVDDATLAGAVVNPVGAFVLARMAAGETDEAALVSAVAAEFDAPREVIEADVKRFLAEAGQGFPAPAGSGRRDPSAGLVEGLRLLLEEGPMELDVRGVSMEPALREGSRATLAAVRVPLPGDVLVFRDASGRLVSHRFLGPYLRRDGLRYLLRGDAAPGPDDAVKPAAVVGRLVTDVRPWDRFRAVGLYARHAFRKRRAAGG